MAALSTNKEFYYGQASVPQMAGTAGYMISILDAILVTGFNSKNVSSISVTSNVATVTTSTAHNYELGNIIGFSGANESIFNDEFEIISIPSTTTFTFSVTTGLTSATGTITCKVAPLGWEKTYSGTNKAVYRSLDPTSNQFYLRVDDTNVQYAAVNIYETMTNVDTGTGASTTKYWKKSNTTDTVARPWYAIGNKKVFYFFSDWNSTYTLQPAVYSFGWFPSFKSGDGYNTMLIGHDSNPTNPYQFDDFAKIGSSVESEGHIIARSYIQLGTYISFYKIMGLNGVHTVMGYDSSYPFPNPVDNGIHLFPVYIYESTSNVLRGKMPGLYAPNEYTNGYFYSRDKTIIVDGKRYIAYRISNSNASGQIGNCWFTLDEEWT